MSPAVKSLPDEEVRRAIRTDLDVSMLVEAAAGTGKTSSLVSRMVALIRNGRCTIDTLAAITFTVKAAAQLRERFQEAVENEIAGTAFGVERERLQAARDNLARSFIGTTHAFCARLLHERPMEAALDPEFEELDEVRAKLLAHEFWTAHVERLVSDSDLRLQELRDAGLPVRFLREGFIRLVQYPDVTMVSGKGPRPDLTAAAGALVRLVADIAPDLPPEDGHEPDELEKVIRKLVQKIRTMDERDPADQFDLLDEANHASRKAVQKRWPDKKKAKEHTDAYKLFVVTTVRPVLEQWRQYVHGVALGLLEPAVKSFETERFRQGTLTFQDLLMRARDLLRDHAHVRLYFQKRFTHLLVDEFQDTDPIQAEVMFYLTGEEVEEKNWRKLVPRPASLFIVGDPKQSIYRFRRADITTYLQVKDRIQNSGGEILRLTSNFRSVPVICQFVNDSFEGSFSGDAVEEGRQADWVGLTATRMDGIFSGVYSLVTPGQKYDEIAEAEANCLATWIRRAVDSGTEIDDEGVIRPLSWSDFLLVGHTRKRLYWYADALERTGIPCEVTGSKAFCDSEELAELMPLLRVIVDAEDQVSLVAFLRGPLCGVDDQALYDFVEAGGRFSFHAATQPATTDPRLSAGLEIARDAWREARLLPPAATIARLIDRLGLLSLAAARDRGSTRSGTLVKALAVARQEAAAGASLSAIVDQFEALLETDSDVEEMSIEPAAADTVRLMNLHQVKGLEAPVVFLIDPGQRWNPNVDIYVDRSGDESRGYIALSRKFGQGSKVVATPAGWSTYEALEKRFHQAEEDRLLYVAGTRARNMLVIGARVAKKAGLDGYWKRLAERVADSPMPAAAKPAAKRQTLTPKKKDFFPVARAAIAAGFAKAGATTYSVLPVTKIAHGSHQELVKVEEGLGKGMSWGRVLHRLFEAILRDETLNVKLYAESLLKDEEREPAEIGEVLSVVDALRRSDLWQRVLSSPHRLMEVPFAVLVPSAEIGLGEGPDTLLHGAIDLVFLEDDVWHVVDYKTDSTKGRLDALVAYYAPQVEHYVRFWSRITGKKAVGGLFFVDGMIERWVV